MYFEVADIYCEKTEVVICILHLFVIKALNAITLNGCIGVSSFGYEFVDNKKTPPVGGVSISKEIRR